MTKPELRKAIRTRLASLSEEERAAKSAAICREIAASDEWAAGRTVGFFSPLASEPNVDLLWAVLGARTVCYPRIDGDNLVFILVPSRAALLESRWNLLEPPHREDAVVPLEELDLLLVPGLAFTPGRHRMGRGKGFYDRLLSRPALRATSFGVCFAPQIVPHLPTEEHDQPVTRLVFA